MKYANPFFKHPENCSYELLYLLRDLPRHLDDEELTSDHKLMLEAASDHASNCNDALLRGLKGLGQVIYAAGSNSEAPASGSDMAGVGELLTEIALQLRFLDDLRGQIRDYNLSTAKTGRSKGRKGGDNE